ncbi:ABC transporter substrate-binding protein [Mahella australiensis]|uniref:Extracellular solute-binding protein family 1 n=1 Tax=Mahella australiensis (strain DSM 15567 / CIP 107919 / 50-1 BON) TaxID=697281 RepID=F3ZYT4_MAHA5|nr:extracellular solute-binding protein [Mahella australiensis]AEE95679.1 extracellular solute-binding protein family 1 [Mahella australiensis 50-1 BON]
MSKKIAMLLVVVMLMTAIMAGCGGNEQQPDATNDGQKTPDQTAEEQQSEEEPPQLDFGGRTIRYTAWWDLTPQPGSSASADRQIARRNELEKKYNCKVEYVNIPWDQYLQKFITAAMAGDSIGDLVTLDSRWFYPTAVANGYLYDLNEFADKGIFDFTEEKWNKDFLKWGTFDGKLYGYAIGRTFPRSVLFWNKSLFEREGLPNLYDLFFNHQWTWDKMLEIAKKATKDKDGDGKIDQWGLSGIDLGFGFVFSNNAESVDVSDPIHPKFVLNSPNALEGLQAWQDFIQKHKVVELNPEGAAWDYPRQSFSNGNVAMLYTQWWMVDDIKKNMKDQYGIIMFPMGPKADEYVSQYSGFTIDTIPSTVKNADQVAIFQNEMTEPYPDEDPEEWKDYYTERVYDEQSVQVIEMLQDKGLSKVDWFGSFDDVVQMSYTFMSEIQNGSKTPQVAISEVAQQAQTLLDNALKKKPEDLIKTDEAGQ